MCSELTCFWEIDKDWDEAVPYVMFAVREAPTESLILAEPAGIRAPCAQPAGYGSRRLVLPPVWSSGIFVENGNVHTEEVTESTRGGLVAPEPCLEAYESLL